MDDLFNSPLLDGKRPDIYLCIFPHLREFLAIDLREQRPQLLLLNTSEVFNQHFFENLETEFSQAVREETEFPFSHLINLPLRMEEIVREVAMDSILERLHIQQYDEEVPSVVVFIVSGGALVTGSERLIEGLKGLLGKPDGEPPPEEWEELFARLVAAEHTALQQVNQQELAEALTGESPDFFTLWEQRN